MNKNQITLGNITITAESDYDDQRVRFFRGGKCIKESWASQIDRFVRPANRPAVHAMIDSVEILHKTVKCDYVVAETPEERICREAQEARDARTPEQIAAHEAELDRYERGARMMRDTMRVQG